MTTTRTPPPVSPPEQAIAPAGPPIRVRLPVGGWQVGFRIQPDGRTVIEVTDQDETLTGLVTSTRLPITSIDAGWSGLTRDPAGGRHWWALAIGHVPADAGQPTVTFTRRTRHRPGAAPPDAVDGLWFAHDGLWVAAATGHHTLARLTTRSATQVRRLRPVTARPAATAPVTREEDRNALQHPAGQLPQKTLNSIWPTSKMGGSTSRPSRSFPPAAARRTEQVPPHRPTVIPYSRSSRAMERDKAPSEPPAAVTRRQHPLPPLAVPRIQLN